MRYIDGPNLKEAIEAGQIKSWQERLRVAIDLIKIIKDAHSVPEGVLHRDIRPANIMLSDLWADAENYKVVVLDFDLSWHRESTGYSIAIAHSVNGFLAPELAGDGQFSTRNALVDSYGIGMTMFYMVTGRAPLFSESKYADWDAKLQKEIASQRCTEWKSLSARWARIVFWATRPHQPTRWDVSRILGALAQLRLALSNALQVTSAELFAEELLARCREGSRLYTWDVDKLCGSFELRTGFTLSISGDESKKTITFTCDWMNTGDRKFENVRKYLGPAVARVEQALRIGGWQVMMKHAATDSIRLSADISVVKLQRANGINDAAKAIDITIESLKLGNI